jgi:hypothetical protein
MTSEQGVLDLLRAFDVQKTLNVKTDTVHCWGQFTKLWNSVVPQSAIFLCIHGRNVMLVNGV